MGAFDYISSLPWQLVPVTVTVYVVSVAIYRLIFHPLGRFPGPKWAAVTGLYEFYWDVIQNGQYTFRIAELHRQYGPIIRISPSELHVNDPAFYDTLYRQDGVWHKYAWAVDAFGAYGATLFTPNHHVHRARRQPLNAFFSKAKVAAHEGQIRFHVGRLCARLDAFAAGDEPVLDLGAATVAVARDVANEFILGKHYDSIGAEDFDAALVIATQGGGGMWRMSKFVRGLGATMQSLPPEWLIKVVDPVMAQFFAFLLMTQQETRRLLAAVAAAEDGPKTVVHEILASKLPDSEKTFRRVFEDASTISGAGFETTASALRMMLFHVYSNPEILQRLRQELDSAAAKVNGEGSRQVAPLKALEQLPYLTSVLMEGMRLSPAIATRMARVTDKDLVYGGKWTIPAGSAVGMTTILLHTDESMYPEPQRFNPDRWMEPDPWTASQQSGKLFVPFSKGTRNCLGLNLAWAEMYLVLAILVQRYDFEFQGVTAKDLEAESDQFAIATRSKGVMHASVSMAE